MFVGVGGSGCKSFVRFVVYVVEMKLFLIEIMKNYK